MTSTVISSPERAAEVARQWPGWSVWTTREGRPVATRTGRQAFIDDGVWALTLICDDWTELERELAGQAANDARGELPARKPQASGHTPAGT
jgi:hypothetical protein